MNGSIMYPDAYLEHYADRWLLLGLQHYGITLLQYLAHPERCEELAERRQKIIATVDATVRPSYLSRIAAEYRAELQAELALEHLPQRNGAPFEPLHHTAWPRSSSADFSKRKVS